MNLKDSEFIESLKIITKNNPWCEIFRGILEKKIELKVEIMKNVYLDQKLLLNLPLICVDLKTYLIEKRAINLEQAKKEYISGASEFNSHPAYWAAFLQVGDARAIDRTILEPKYWIITIILLIVGLLLLARWLSTKPKSID